MNPPEGPARTLRSRGSRPSLLHTLKPHARGSPMALTLWDRLCLCLHTLGPVRGLWVGQQGLAHAPCPIGCFVM